MAFRPAGVMLFCLCLAAVISIPCIIIMLKVSNSSGVYAVSMAILTGVVASAIVSVSIELANNYRQNRIRFVVLNEYLYMVSMYEQFIKWGSHGNYEKIDAQKPINWFDDELELTPRMSAVAEVILEYSSVIENAVVSGKEYLSIDELQIAMQALDAVDHLGEITGDIINNHLSGRKYSIYDVLDETLKSRISEFSEFVGVYIVDDELESVVCDYCLNSLDELGNIGDDEEINELDRLSRNQIIHCLWDFDQAMHKLQPIAKGEPVVYENLIPFEERMEKMERKIFGKEYERVVAEREAHLHQTLKLSESENRKAKGSEE